ncbi:hypothetical protein GP486_001448 [Trichoglossum hirsutum]|uniref:Adaptive response protein AidB N-terminal domain-containing protein n=1 Tax=Trichoglossum hirsutum TaxID=265104 RepID=A0A9P8RSM3_9PEZI|nr:hypothetical protein GP486_001448 [Trichoglossum hirsutum]
MNSAWSDSSAGKSSDANKQWHSSEPSSSTTGFFQPGPKLTNQFFEDAALGLFLPATILSTIRDDFSRFGDIVLSRQVLSWVADAEQNPPFVRTCDMWGKRKDELVTSGGWKRLQDLGIAEG